MTIKRVDSPKSLDPVKTDTLLVNRSSRGFSFQKGDTIQVSVERVLHSEKVLLTIEGQRVTAATTSPLKEGENIRVLVEQKNPLLLLRPIKGSSDLAALLSASVRKAPPWDIDMGKLFFKLLAESALKDNAGFFLTLKSAVLEESALSGGGRYGAERLQELIKNSGLFLESRLNGSSPDANIRNLDLKAALLRALEMYKSADSPGKKRVLNEVKALLSAVESFQNINSLNRERGESLAITIPFHFQGEPRSLKIFVNNRKKGEKEREKNEFQISLMLELGALKKIRADILKNRTDIFVTLYVENELIKERVQADFENLMEKIGELGFSAHTNCFVSTEKYLEEEIPGKEFISDLHRTINFTV